MVNSFDEEVKALEEYGHDCCARIDDRIHECCKRIKEAHEQELDNMRYAYEVSMALMKKQLSPVTYDVLGNERHKAVCELRKLPDGYQSYSSFPFAKWYKDLSLALGIGDGVISCARVRDTLIHLLGGDQVPATLGDPYGISKEGDGGVDAGRSDQNGGGCDDAAAAGRDGDCAGNPLAEGVAPITGELREKSTRVAEADSRWEYAIKDLERTQAERDALAEALDRAYEKNRNQRKQLTEVQEALHRRNEGELKRRWMREKQDLELQIAKMRLESVELPKDADGEVWRIGDELLDDGMVCEVVGIGPNRLYYYVDATDTVEWTQADSRRHYHAPTVEDVLREMHAELDEVTALYVGEAIDSDERDRDEARIFAEYAAKLRLASNEE